MSADEKTAPPELSITFVNANLIFIAEPLILGHYESSVLTGSEKVLDRILDKTLQTALDLGRYPDRPGTAQVFVNTGAKTDGTIVNSDNPMQPPRPEAVVVVGLGDRFQIWNRDAFQAHRAAQREVAREGLATMRAQQRAAKLSAPKEATGG